MERRGVTFDTGFTRGAIFAPQNPAVFRKNLTLEDNLLGQSKLCPSTFTLGAKRLFLARNGGNQMSELEKCVILSGRGRGNGTL